MMVALANSTTFIVEGVVTDVFENDVDSSSVGGGMMEFSGSDTMKDEGMDHAGSKVVVILFEGMKKSDCSAGGGGPLPHHEKGGTGTPGGSCPSPAFVGWWMKASGEPYHKSKSY